MPTASATRKSANCSTRWFVSGRSPPAITKKQGRVDSVDEEQREIAVIQRFLPAKLDPDAQIAAVNAVVGDLGASGMRDMGRVMAELKRRYAGQMDFGEISRTVKAALAA